MQLSPRVARYSYGFLLALSILLPLIAQADPPAITAPPTPTKHFITLKADAQGRLGDGTPLQGVHRIACLGDSITQWFDGPNGWVGMLRAYLTAIYPPKSIEVINAGVAGNTASDELGRLDNDVLKKKPDLMTLSVGVNDVMHQWDKDHPQGGGPGGLSLPLYRADVETIVTRAQQQGIIVVIFSPTVIGEDLDNAQNAELAGYTTALREIAHRHKCCFIDLQQPFFTYIDINRTAGNTNNILAGDGVHPSDEGNRVIAATVITALLSTAPPGKTLHAP